MFQVKLKLKAYGHQMIHKQKIHFLLTSNSSFMEEKPSFKIYGTFSVPVIHNTQPKALSWSENMRETLNLQ
jgi:hypothetical protein